MPMISRRGLVGGALAGGAALGFSGCAATGRTGIMSATGSITTFPIWPGSAPGGVSVSVTEQEIPRSPTGPADDTAFVHVTTPTLSYLKPAQPNGAAMLLIPGGSYQRVAIGHGGRALMQAFATLGYATYLLKYRLPGDGWAAGPDAPLQDAERALRLIRAAAAGDGYDATRIGVWGGSAGGHLAARLLQSRVAHYPAIDAVDAQPLDVKAAVLLYPVNLMSGDFVHAPSRAQLLRSGNVHAEDVAAEAGVAATTPPTFLAHAIDDTVVPVENGISYWQALRQHRVPCEFYAQERGGHGFAWAQKDGAPWPWTSLAAAFLKRHGV